MENIEILQRVAEMERRRYSSVGDYSVTDLISPPRIVALRKRHQEDIEQPLASVVAAMYGTAVHEYFEKYLRKWVKISGYPGYTFEEQISTKIKDRIVSGRYDIRDNKVLTDLKTCKVWKKVFDPHLVEWTQQQNLYAYLLKNARSIEVTKLNIIAFYKDWEERAMIRNSQNSVEYPKTQIEEIELELWSPEKQEFYCHDRLSLHMSNEDLPDSLLTPCSREERWERFPDGEQVQYAIMKTPKSKRAARVIKTTLADAVEVASTMKGITKDSFIEVRYAKRVRCENWCPVNKFCDIFQEYANKKKSGKLNDYIPLGV